MCSSPCSPHFQVKILTLMYLWAQSKPAEFAEITRNKLATIGIPIHRLSGKAGRFMKLKSEQVCMLGVRGGRGWEQPSEDRRHVQKAVQAARTLNGLLLRANGRR